MIRFRFTIRTLLILVSLVGLYFGCWEVTKRWGVGEYPLVDSGISGVYPLIDENMPSGVDDGPYPFDSSPAPFVVSREQYRESCREYHFWFFGYTAKLPFEREVKFQGDEEFRNFLEMGNGVVGPDLRPLPEPK